MKRSQQLKLAPLLDSLQKRSSYLGFHTPGHQRGQGLWQPFKELMHDCGACLDLTELPGLDNLAVAQGCIAQSQKNMAALVGAAETFYLVNGSTCGLQAGLLATNRSSGKVLLPLNAHMSLYHGLVLTGGKLVLLPVVIDAEWGIPLGVDPQIFADKESSLLGDAEVLVSVNPTYHGVAADLSKTRGWLQNHPHTAWLVDEAHGPHFPYTTKNYSALSYDADIVVHSTHKMMNSLTQTALLHCGKEAWVQRIQQALNMIQSSSPSYLFMGSLDALQAQLHETDGETLNNTVDLAKQLAEEIRKLEAYRLWQDELAKQWWADPCKITLSAEPIGLTGWELAEKLRKDYHIDVELAGQAYILLLVTMGHQEKDCLRLIKALKEIRDKAANYESRIEIMGSNINIQLSDQCLEPVLTPRELYYQQHQAIKIEECVGRVAAAAVVPYPPGVPLIYPGMVITKKHTDAIIEWLKQGGYCVGVQEQIKQPKLLVC